MGLIFTAVLPILVIAFLCCAARLVKVKRKTHMVLSEWWVIVEKDYIPARWVVVRVGESEIPRYRRRRFCVALQREGEPTSAVHWKSVSKKEYHSYEVGERYPKNNG